MYFARNKIVTARCGGKKSRPKCPIPLFSMKSAITSQLLTKMADMKTKIHVVLVNDYLLEINWGKHTFLGIENHINVPKWRFDILFDTRRSGSV